MSKTYDFICECGAFFVLSVHAGGPAGRPFGAIMEYEENLYISTADNKSVYQQLKDNGRVQIVALKPGTRQWIRVSGNAYECTDPEMKKMMLNKCPVLTKHFSAWDAPHYSIFRIQVENSEIFE